VFAIGKGGLAIGKRGLAIGKGGLAIGKKMSASNYTGSRSTNRLPFKYNRPPHVTYAHLVRWIVISPPEFGALI
jgi:hypothetical protein